MVTRFAPAPTGHLHLGHVLNAVYVWGAAREAGGRVLLRIEDHDRERSRPEFEQRDPRGSRLARFRARRDGQAERARRDLRSGARRARSKGLVYACDCTRAEIAAQAAPGGAKNDERRYPGTCRGKGLAESAGVGLRVRLDPSVERFYDGRHGTQEQRPSAQCGDLLVRDRLGNWTYQFVAAVDDCGRASPT